MIEECMRNTYGILTNRCTVEDILEQYDGVDGMFYGNPYSITIEDIDEMIEFFENYEEYEKCEELIEVKNYLDFDNFLHGLVEKNGVTMY